MAALSFLNFNFELMRPECAGAFGALQKVQQDMADNDKLLKIMTDQNSELLRLLDIFVVCGEAARPALQLRAVVG